MIRQVRRKIYTKILSNRQLCGASLQPSNVVFQSHRCMWCYRFILQFLEVPLPPTALGALHSKYSGEGVLCDQKHLPDFIMQKNINKDVVKLPIVWCRALSIECRLLKPSLNLVLKYSSHQIDPQCCRCSSFLSLKNNNALALAGLTSLRQKRY